MKSGAIVWHGEIYVSVESAAAWYRIEVTEIERWASEELLDPPRVVEGERALTLAAVDRLARLVHYSRVLGLHETAMRLMVRR